LINLRSDRFERAYAIKWLTALVSVLDCSDDMDNEGNEIIIHNAAALLAVCAGTSSAGKVTRDFVFDYHPIKHESGKSTPLTIHITDLSLDNDNFGSVGAQTWGGSCVLSDLIAQDPESFGLTAAQLNARDSDVFRILELGAGTGLVSLTVCSIIQQLKLPNNQRVEVVATDYYPRVLENLHNNIEFNFPQSGSSSNMSIVAHPLDWSTFVPEGTHDGLFEKPFDLILGADIIYEPEHAPWIKACLLHLLRQPSTIEIPLFHLIVTKRSTHSFEASVIENVFFNGCDPLIPCLKVVDRNILTYGADTKEEVEYVYYKIGWFCPAQRA
jgi:predicted nicotinamide N-methyase